MLINLTFFFLFSHSLFYLSLIFINIFFTLSRFFLLPLPQPGPLPQNPLGPYYPRVGQSHPSHPPKQVWSIPRTNFSAAVFEDAIYVMGGLNGYETISQCEKYDGSFWSPVHSLPKNIAAGAGITIDRPANIENIIERLYKFT